MKLAKVLFWISVGLSALGIVALSVFLARSPIGWIAVAIAMGLIIAALICLLVSAGALVKSEDAKVAAANADAKAPKAY